MPSHRRQLPILIAICALFFGAASADEVVLRDGMPIRGLVLKESERLVVLLVPGGIQAIPRARVSAVNRTGGGRRTADSSPGARVHVVAPSDGGGTTAGGRKSRRTGRQHVLDGNHKVALTFSGSLAGKDVDPADEWVRGRIAKFLGSRCDPPLELLAATANAADADLRMTISVNVTLGNAVTFYGVSLGRNASSTLAFKLESTSKPATDGEAEQAPESAVERVLLVQGAIDHSLMGASNNASGGDDASLPNRALQGTIEKLLKQLAAVELFGIKQQPK